MKAQWVTRQAMECEGYEAICSGCDEAVEWLEILLIEPEPEDDTTMISGFRCPRCKWEMRMVSDEALLMIKELPDEQSKYDNLPHGDLTMR